MSYKNALKSYLPIDLDDMRGDQFYKNINAKIFEQVDIVHKKGWREVKSCPVCNSNQRLKRFVKFDIKMYECEKCELIYNEKFPLKDGLIYKEDSYLEKAQSSYLINRDYRIERFGNERKKILESLGLKIDQLVLDVGCGTGWFIESMLMGGYRIIGQDLSPSLAKWTSNYLNVTVYSLPLEEIELEEKVDFITMFDLIEHVEDPLGLIRNAKKKLKEDGIILCFTPNSDSLGIDWMQEASSQITPAEHLTLFNRNSISVLAEKVNAEVIFYETRGLDIGDLYAHYEFLGNKEVAQFFKRFADRLQPIIDQAECGNHCRFALKFKK